MSKKQIKELIIHTSSVGSKEATKEIQSLEAALNGATVSSKDLNTELKVGSKYLGQISIAYSNVSKSVNSSVEGIRKLNTALNGDTKKAAQSISAYVDNLQILDMYLRDVTKSASTAARALGTMSTATQMDKMLDLMEGMITSVGMVVGELEELNSAMKSVDVNTGKTAGRIKEARDNISQLDVTVNRGNENFEEYGYQILSTGHSMGKTKAQSDKLNNSIKNLNGTGSQGARAFSSLAFGMNPLVSTYAAIAVNIYALSEAFRVLKDAAALDRLATQTAQFSASISGINVKALAEDMQEASGGALAMGEAMKQSVRGVSYGFIAEDLIRLTEGARKASVALGVDFTDAMDRVLRGISKGEVELLDEVGVVTRLDTAYQKYAVSIGKTSDELSDYQRKVALTTEVMSQLDKKFKAFDTSANSLERLGVATKNLVDTLLMGTARAGDGVFGQMADFIKALTPMKTSIDKARESLSIYNKALEEGKPDQAIVALAEYNKLMQQVSLENTKGTEANLALTNSLEAQASAVDTVVLSLEVIAGYFARGAIIAGLSAIVTALGSAIAATASFVSLAMAAAPVVGGLTAAIVALTSPIWLTTAAVIAAAAAVAGLIYWLAPDIFVDAIDGCIDAIGMLVDGLKDFGLWVGDKLGISSFVSDLFGLNETLGKTTNSMVALNKARLQGGGEGFEAGLNSTAAFSSQKQGTAEFNLLKTMQEERIALTERQKVANAQERIAFANGMRDNVDSVKELAKELEVPLTGMEKLAQKAKDIVPPGGFIPSSNTNDLKMAEDMFNELVSAGIIAKGVMFDAGRGLLAFSESVGKASTMLKEYGKTREVLEAQKSAELFGVDDADIKSIEYAIELNNRALSAQADLGAKINSAEREKLTSSNLILEAKLKELNISKELESLDRARALGLSSDLNIAKAMGKSEYEQLNIRKEYLEQEISQLAAKKQSTKEQEHQLAMLKQEIELAKELENIERRKVALEVQLSQQQARTAQTGNSRDRAASLQKELDIKKQIFETEKATMTQSQITKTSSDLALEQQSVTGATKGAGFADTASVMGNIAGLEGLSDLQSTFAGTMSSISGTYASFLTDMEGSGKSFSEYLAGNIDAMSNVLSSSLSLANAAFQEISKGKIASIDAEIEAEKRRDGKSEESLAKIKSLQAKKIKEEAKAKKASVGMSTATAIMQAMAQIPYPVNIAMAAAVGAMGMLQMANIDKAASGQMASLNSGGGNLSITSGSRKNEIDVSKSANAGESAYLRGASGTGTANNFIPGRAVGNYASAGTSITVGESGPEVITPAIPINVTPAGQSTSSGPSIVFSPVFNAQAVDSTGMAALFESYSRQLYDGLERELNARNQTLNNL